jgi:RNA polymerase sigma factor (sigma-70 family)
MLIVMALPVGVGGRQGGWDTRAVRRHLNDMSSLAPDAAIASVVQLAAAGDEVAFARIVAGHRTEMVRVAFVVCGDWDLAQDAAQAALWIAWRKLPHLRDPEHLRPWLLAVVANEARAILRRRRRHPVVELTIAVDREDGVDPVDEIGQVDLSNALHRLSPEDRSLVALRYLADLDSTEIGRLTGRSASGVRTRLSRVLDHLRKELDDG